MYLKKLLLGFIFLFIFINFILVYNINAEEPTENRVDGFFDIELISGTELIVNISIDVDKLTLSANNVTYDKGEIKDIGENKPELMGAIKYALKSMLTEQIKQTFEKAYVTSINELPLYENEMFYDSYNVKLKSSYFNMNSSVDANEVINGLLDIGALIDYTFNLKAKQGWNNYYTFILNQKIGYQRTTGSVNGDKIQWIIKNEDDKHFSLIAELTIKNNNPTTANIKKEEIGLTFNLNCKSGKTTFFTTNITVKSINISNYNIFPGYVHNLRIIPSDGIRLFTNNNLLSYDGIYNKTIEPIKKKIVTKIENSSFNQKLNLFFKWDSNTTINCTSPYDIIKMDSNPPIIAILTDADVKIQLCGITSRAFLGLVNAGAKANITEGDINFGDRLDEIGYPYNIYFYLPDNIYFNEENIYVWNDSKPFKGEFKSDIANIYSQEKINTSIELEVKSSDLNILSFFTGGTTLGLNLFLIEEQNRSVTSLPDYFNLPEKISLNYFNSDAFRLCVEEKVFTNESIDLFLESQKENFEKRIMTIFPGVDIEGSTDINEFYESLIWDYDINNIDDNDPIEIVTYSHCSYTIPFKFSFITPRFEISNQKLNFTGIKNQNVKYKIIFPNGINVKANDSLNAAIINKTKDGRYYIEINFNESNSGLIDTLSFKIIPSFVFIITLFIPCILSMLIAIILVIVIYIIRKKRKRGKGILNKEKYKKSENIEEKDYYIPPPPPSYR